MPKKSRDEFAPRDKREPYKWKCKHCGMSGKAATKEQAKDALLLHMYFNH